MPIVVQCQCGGKFQAKDELAGKTLKCPSCRQPIQVAAPQTKKPAPKPAGKTIALKCKCGQKLKVPANMAGKKVKCKKCQTPLTIPAGKPKPGPKPQQPSPAADTIKVQCKCGQIYSVKASMAGKGVKCQKCGAAMKIPGSKPAAPKPQPAADPLNDPLDLGAMDLDSAELGAGPLDDPLGGALGDDPLGGPLANDPLGAPAPATSTFQPGGAPTFQPGAPNPGGQPQPAATGSKMNLPLILGIGGGAAVLLLLIVGGVVAYSFMFSGGNDPVALRTADGGSGPTDAAPGDGSETGNDGDSNTTPGENTDAEGGDSQGANSTNDAQPSKIDVVGDWMLVSLNGRKNGISGGRDFRFEEERVAFGMPGMLNYSVNDSVSPATITLSLPDGKVANGLVKQEGKNMTICLMHPRHANYTPGKKATAFRESEGDIFFFEKAKPKPQPLVRLGREVPAAYKGQAAFRADGKVVAAVMAYDFIIWDLENNRKIDRISLPLRGAVSQAEFSPDGSLIAIASEYPGDDGLFGGVIYNPQTKETTRTFNKECAYIHFSPDGQTIGVGGTGVSPTLWDASTGELKHELKVEKNASRSGSFSTDGSLFATCTYYDNSVRVFNTQTGAPTAAISLGDDANCLDVLFSPDGKSLYATRNPDALVRINLADNSTEIVVEPEDEIRSMAFSADGETIVLGTRERVEIRNTSGFELIEAFEVRGSYIQAAMTPDARFVAGAASGVCDVFDRQSTGPEQKTLVWPPPMTPEQQQAESKNRQMMNMLSAFINVDKGWANVQQNGQSVLSWRVRTAELDNSRLQYEAAPWDSPKNKQLVDQMPPIFATPGVPENKTVWQMVGGPGTAYTGTEKVNRGSDEFTIQMVEAAPENAVIWTQPKDFTYNPSDPWQGLPREGFIAIFWDGSRGFVSGETPPDVLKAMFTVDGGETVDRQRWVKSTIASFAYGPDEQNPAPPFVKP